MSVVLALFGKKSCIKRQFFVWLARKSFNCVEFSKKYGNWKTEGWVRTETVSSQKRRILGTLKFMHNRWHLRPVWPGQVVEWIAFFKDMGWLRWDFFWPRQKKTKNRDSSFQDSFNPAEMFYRWQKADVMGTETCFCALWFVNKMYFFSTLNLIHKKRTLNLTLNSKHIS